MGFKYEYKTDEELELTFKKLTPGECRFFINKATDKDDRGFELTTQAGYSRIDLELVVVDANGEKGLVKDILAGNAAWKIKELCKAVGVPQLYSAKGDFDPQALVGLEGKAVLKDRTFTKRDGSEGVASSIEAYTGGALLSADKIEAVLQKAGLAQQAEMGVEVLEDDLPF